MYWIWIERGQEADAGYQDRWPYVIAWTGLGSKVFMKRNVVLVHIMSETKIEINTFEVGECSTDRVDLVIHPRRICVLLNL